MGEPAAPDRPLPRSGLAVLAVVAACVDQVLQVLPWVFGPLLGALWFNRTWLLGGAVGVGVLLAWAMQPALRIGGRVVRREQAPALFALVDELRGRLDSPPVTDIRLEDDAFNASVMEVGPSCFRWRTRRILFLGIPFLAAVDVAALRAVSAHELGHFSRRHGRLGHWLYRARAAWLRRAQAVDAKGSSVLERALAQTAQAFAPWTASAIRGRANTRLTRMPPRRLARTPWLRR